VKKLLILLLAAVTASVALGAAGPAVAKKNKHHAVHGVVQAVGADSLTLKRKQGSPATIQVSSDTKIVVNGKPGALSDIQVGYRALVRLKAAGGPAKAIRAHQPPAPGAVVRGRVDSVGTDSITIKKKDGTLVPIPVDSNTKIRVKGKPGALADIHPGDRALVLRTSADGPAKAIRVGGRHHLRLLLRGVIESVGSDSLIVKVRNGDPVTVPVTADTRIFVAGHGAATLSDLQAGFRVLVLRAGATGPVLAILARPPHA
jgi:uncharacterized protein DUF5666